MPASARNKIGIVKEILEELESKLGKSIPFEEVQKNGTGERNAKDRT